MAIGKAVSTVRRKPYRSMPMPMKNCVTPNDSANSPANAPSDAGDRPKSPCNPPAMMAVTVRNAWLNAKADSSDSSITQSVACEGGSAAGGGGSGVGEAGLA